MEPSLVSNTVAVVFVDFAGKTPQYFVMPGHWLKEDVARRYRAELARKGESAPKLRSRHYLVKSAHLEQWLDKWNTLGGQG